MTENTWPDPARPGVPLNPEKDGWHIVQEGDLDPEFAFWRAKPWLEHALGCWETKGTEDEFCPHEISNWRYLGPVLPPDEASALQKRVAELEGLVKYMGGQNDDHIRVAFAGNPVVVEALLARIDAALTGGKDE